MEEILQRVALPLMHFAFATLHFGALFQHSTFYVVKIIIFIINVVFIVLSVALQMVYESRPAIRQT